MQEKSQLAHRNKAPIFPSQHHKMRINSVIEHFHSLVTSRLFSASCLISLIRSNRIRLSVFSGQTFHSTGGISRCTFHLFLMAGPSGIGLAGPLPPAHPSLSLRSPPPRSPPAVRVNGLRLEVVLSLSVILWLLKPASSLWGQDVSCVLCLWSSRALHWTND